MDQSDTIKRISYDEYTKRWKDLNYVFHVLALAQALNADGCSGVTEYYHIGCLEHDIAYRTGFDPLGIRVDKAEADKRFRWYMNSKSKFGRLGPMAYWRYFAVKWFGDKSWKADKPFPDVTFLDQRHAIDPNSISLSTPKLSAPNPKS